jgi:hypothetical protein
MSLRMVQIRQNLKKHNIDVQHAREDPALEQHVHQR